MKPESGEFWLADFGWSAKTRPVVVLSIDDPNPPRELYFLIITDLGDP